MTEEPDTVIKRLLPTIGRIAKRLRAQFPAFSTDDLQQVGAQGALKAMARVDQYDASKGKLDTWLYKWIRGAMLMHIREAAASHRYENEATHAVDNAIHKLANGKALADEVFSVADSYAVSAYSRQTPEEALVARETVEVVEAFCAELSERDQAFVRLRYVEELTLEEIGSELGYSKSALSRVEHRILERLHRHMARGR